MAIARTGAVEISGGNGLAFTSVTRSLTNTGACLLVFTSSNPTVTSITFNGVNLSLIVGSGNNTVWGLLTADVTTANIVLNTSAQPWFFSATSQQYSGVLSVSKSETFTDIVSETDYTTNHNVPNDGDWGIGWAIHGSGPPAPTFSGSFTRNITDTMFSNTAAGDTNATALSATSLHFTSTSTAASNASHFFVALSNFVGLSVFADTAGSFEASLIARSANERRRTVWWS